VTVASYRKARYVGKPDTLQIAHVVLQQGQVYRVPSSTVDRHRGAFVVVPNFTAAIDIQQRPVWADPRQRAKLVKE